MGLFGKKKNIETGMYRGDPKKRFLCDHVSGLSVAQGTQCMVIFEDEQISIENNAFAFDLKNDRVKNIEIVEEKEIENFLISSAGGAIAGAVLFGAVGAAIGGRTKKKTAEIIEHYFIITYVKDGEIACLSFRIDHISMLNIAANIVRSYHKEKNTESQSVQRVEL